MFIYLYICQTISVIRIADSDTISARKEMSKLSPVGTSRNGCRVKQELLNADIACGKNSFLYLFNGCYIKRIGKIACPFSIGTISKKYGGIVPNIVPNIVPIELQKPLFYAAVGKEKDGTFFTSTEKYLTKSCNKYRK